MLFEMTDLGFVAPFPDPDVAEDPPSASLRTQVKQLAAIFKGSGGHTARISGEPVSTRGGNARPRDRQSTERAMQTVALLTSECRDRISAELERNPPDGDTEAVHTVEVLHSVADFNRQLAERLLGGDRKPRQSFSAR
jgi:hypothetical protein